MTDGVEGHGSKRGRGHSFGLTVDAIVETAKTVMATEGVSASVRVVAARLGVTHSTVVDFLKRRQTTLAGELARDFLDGLSTRMMPGERWEGHIHGLFGRAMSACETCPGLLQVVLPFMSDALSLSPSLTEHLLYVLRSAGVAESACPAMAEFVMSAVAGAIVWNVPATTDAPDRWLSGLSARLDEWDARHWPLAHASKAAVVELAAGKIGAGADAGPPDPLTLTIGAIIFHIRRNRLK